MRVTLRSLTFVATVWGSVMEGDGLVVMELLRISNAKFSL